MSRPATSTLAAEPVPSRQRSVLTNDPRRLAGVDMRSAAGRRFRDIVEALQREHGAESDPSRLREVASLKLTLEAAQAAALNGDAAMTTEVVRLSNLIARRERDLRLRRKAAPPGPSLLERALAKHQKGSQT